MILSQGGGDVDQTELDTKDGIARHLLTYEGFYTLVTARKKFGEEYPGSLTEFYVLGRFCMATSGACERLNRDAFTDTDRAAAPSVMTRKEFWTFLGPICERPGRPKPRPPIYDRIGGIDGVTPVIPIPPPHIVCAKCGKGGWTIEQCHDINGTTERVSVPLNPFIGKSLAMIQEDLKAHTDSVWCLRTSIRNDRWVDREVPEALRTPRGDGWRTENDQECPIDWSYVAQSGDTAKVTVDRYYHGPCYRELYAERERAQDEQVRQLFNQLFRVAGFGGVSVEHIDIPEHVFTALTTSDDDRDRAEVESQIVYFRATTGLGILNIFIWEGRPFIDLTDTGISPESFDPSDTLINTGIPACAAEPRVIIRLWQLIVGNASRKLQQEEEL